MSYRYCYIMCTVVSSAALASCRKPYTPAEINSPGSYFVGEGTINNGTDSTIIKLSRPVNLSGKVNVPPQLNVIVTIEGDNNTTYSLIDAGKGNYITPGLNLNAAQKYRLKIQTIKHGQYLSDYVPVVATPPVDSLYYRLNNDDVQLYLDTHDPANKLKYYRWEYQRSLPAWLDPVVPDEGCKGHAYYYKYRDSISGNIINQEDQHINYNKAFFTPEIAIVGIYMKGNPYPIGFTASYPECVDYTLRGTNKQPDFWQ